MRRPARVRNRVTSVNKSRAISRGDFLREFPNYLISSKRAKKVNKSVRRTAQDRTRSFSYTKGCASCPERSKETEADSLSGATPCLEWTKGEALLGREELIRLEGRSGHVSGRPRAQQDNPLLSPFPSSLAGQGLLPDNACIVCPLPLESSRF